MRLSYQDIYIKKMDGFPIHAILSMLMKSVHYALVESKDDQGKIRTSVSFPDYGEKNGRLSLGNRVRLIYFAEPFDVFTFVRNISDYISVSRAKYIPENYQLFTFERMQTKGNTEYLARSRAKVLNIDYETALDFLRKSESWREKNKREIGRYPFICIGSSSTGHKFSLSIAKKPSDGEINYKANFSSYGLSRQYPVPFF